MLECPALLLDSPRTSGSRSILAAETGKKVGFAEARPLSGIWGWLGASIIEVREEEDAPLLCTIWRRFAWSLRREVRDAEGYTVGAVVGRIVLNEFNRRIAECTPLSAGQGSMLTPRGELLATLETTATGLKLEFRPEVEGDPFLKMLLLAAALLM